MNNTGLPVHKHVSAGSDSLLDKFDSRWKVSLDVFEGHVQHVYHLILELLLMFALFNIYPWEKRVDASCHLKNMRNPL